MVLLEVTCGRWSFSRADLDQADPSDLLESLGGVSGLGSDPVVPLGTPGGARAGDGTAPADPLPFTEANKEHSAPLPPGAAIVLGSRADEDELEQLQAELTEQEAILLRKEVEVATLRAETHAFHVRYMDRVGNLYAKLDRLKARIAEILARLRPDDLGARQEAEAAERLAEESEQAAAEAEREARSQRPAFFASDALKKLFREVAKRIHPDLVTDPAERAVRTSRMAEANRAYQAGDEEGLRRILEDWDAVESDGGAGPAKAERARLVQAIRNVRERIRVLDEELASLRVSELYGLMITVAEEEARGDDPLADLARDADFHIRQTEIRLNELRKQNRG